MIRCDICSCPIDPDRVLAMGYNVASPSIRCVKHAETIETRGFLSFDHKTGGTVIVASGRENIRRADRQYRRAR